MAQIEIEAKPTNSLLSDNRIGKFQIDDVFFMRSTKEELLALMGNFVVVRCEHRYDVQRFEYTAFSPLFEKVPEAYEPPFYLIQCTNGEWFSAIKQ